MMRSYELRLVPTQDQRQKFSDILRDSQETYNAALQERIEAWKMDRKRISLYDQFGELTELRKDERFASIAVNIQREPLRRLDAAMNGFFRRVKGGEKPGFPRFRSRERYNSFAWQGPHLDTHSVLVPKVGHIQFKLHQKIAGTPKHFTIKRVGNKWVGRVVCDIGPAPEKCVVASAVGIDLGLTTFVTLSDGGEIQNPRFVRKHAERIARAQKNLARKKRGSKNRLKAKEAARRAYQRMADARKNYCHHVSKQLVGTYDLIAHEDLKISNMVRSNLGKSILDAAWGPLLFQLAYKAESAGRHVIAVNPRNTSQMCSACGVLVRKKLSERQHVCGCGADLGRDHNAALNVLSLGRRLAAGKTASGGLTR